ncbi:CdaR family protein [Lactovum odontotermitis]
MISKILNSRGFLIIVSVILALILFANATSTTVRNQGKNQTDGQVFTATLTDIPIDIKYNDEKYFISGYTSTAAVTLSSYNQIELLQEKSADKRTFKLAADLTKMSPGTHTVPISVEDLTKTVNAKTNPTTMNVTVEKKQTKSFKISTVVDRSLVPEGYYLGLITLSDYKVNVTAGTHSIKNIDKIEAVLPSSTNLESESTATVGLIAVDKTGKIVPAKMDKSTVKMTVEIVKNGEKPGTITSSSMNSSTSSSTSATK